MLEVREVVKSFDGRTVVNRASFEVQPGEAFALLGPNGAWKTTLIRMITDILRPDSGTVVLPGGGQDRAGRRLIGYLPEERGLYRRQKVHETLAYYGELKGMKAGAAREAAMKLLERVELGEWAHKQVQALSKGMQQKVQLCTALIGEPPVLLLDEPFSGLDPINVQLLETLLHERRAAGATVLLSTHQMNKVEELCDRALMINHGHMVLYGSVRDIRRQYADHAVVLRARAARGSPGGALGGEVQRRSQAGAGAPGHASRRAPGAPRPRCRDRVVQRRHATARRRVREGGARRARAGSRPERHRG